MKVRNLIGIKAVESFQLLPPVFQANFSTASHEGSSKFPATGFKCGGNASLGYSSQTMVLCHSGNENSLRNGSHGSEGTAD